MRTKQKRGLAAACWMAAGLAMVGTMLAGCGKENSAKAAAGAGSAKAVPVTVAEVRIMPLQRTVHVVGSLLPLERATLGNRVTGNVTKIYVELGDQVKPGQRLAEIDPERYELAIQQAEQSLQESLAKLGLKEIPTGAFDVDQTATVKKALSEEEAEKVKFERTNALYQQHLIKDFEYFDAKAAFQVAQNGVLSARDDAQSLLAAARQKRKSIDVLRKDLADATIKAPDGTTPDGQAIASYTVAERRISPGEYVREGTSMFTLVSDGTLKLQARVPEKYLGQVKIGQTVQFNVEAYPDQPFSGRITTMDPTVDEASRMFRFEARVENREGRLRPGSFVQGEVMTHSEEAVLVPVDAITSFAGVNKIYVLSEEGGQQRAHAVAVLMGQEQTERQGELQRTWVEVLPAEGKATKAFVPTGTRVATSGLSKLYDGSVVQVQKPESKTEQTTALSAESR